MKNIASWKNADVNSKNSPVADAKLDKEMLGKVSGGGASEGYICGVSGEVNGGKSCWDVLIEDIFGW